MQIKKNGLKLMKDTASLTNALIENIGMKDGIKVGDTFAELQWTDRTLWVITWVAPNGKEFMAKRAQTKMKDWTDGTEYPVRLEDGTIETVGSECFFKFRYRNWWGYSDTQMNNGEKVHLSFGETTGYRDPSF